MAVDAADISVEVSAHYVAQVVDSGAQFQLKVARNSDEVVRNLGEVVRNFGEVVPSLTGVGGNFGRVGRNLVKVTVNFGKVTDSGVKVTRSHGKVGVNLGRGQAFRLNPKTGVEAAEGAEGADKQQLGGSFKTA